jgi:hypothetical protein
MVWDVMVPVTFVVVSVAVLDCFDFRFILTWSKKPPQVAPQHRLLASSLYSRLRQGPIEIQDRGPHAEGKKKRLHGSGYNRRTI